MNKKLTIGMATYDDYDGVYFTIQSLRLYHDLDEKDVDLLVVDNNPSSKHGEETKKFVENKIGGKYVPYTEKNSTSVRNLIFKNSQSKYTLCVDPHVMIVKNGITHLINYFDWIHLFQNN